MTCVKWLYYSVSVLQISKYKPLVRAIMSNTFFETCGHASLLIDYLLRVILCAITDAKNVAMLILFEVIDFIIR